ncbi:MAG: 16S rRNA (guanine(1207)-N(2))-methyltransferase RsmC [Sodalis sp. (in: enterobacteria)]
MCVLIPDSELLLRHQDRFLDKQVLFSGNVRDFLPVLLKTRSVLVHTIWFHHWQILSRALGEQVVHFGLMVDSALVGEYDTLIYFWPKNKSEAFFQLTHLLSFLPLGCDVFIVGENHSGVRSAKSILEAWCPLSKIDGARCCRLYQGVLIQQSYFDAKDYWKTYQVEDVIIKTLPGVFSRDGLDHGSELLLSTFDQSIQGHVADIGCGSGVLSAVLGKRSAEVQLTLSDAHAPALEASRATLAANCLEGKVLAGNIYSGIVGRFDMIISNPPFHDGMHINLKAVQMLIRESIYHLRIGGELRIVANAFLPYPDLLDTVFGNHQVLMQNGCFKIYQAFHQVQRDRNKNKKLR